MSIDLHCMINRLASRGCCLFLPGPGKGRYQRRDCHYPKGDYTHEVSWGKGGTLIIPYTVSLYMVFDAQDLHRFIEGEMINFSCPTNILMINLCIVSTDFALLSSTASVRGALFSVPKVSMCLLNSKVPI